MDLWVVAALTGAGYAAKYLQNLSRDKEGVSVSKKLSVHCNSPTVETPSTSGFEAQISDSCDEGIEASARAMGGLRGYTRGQKLRTSRHNNRMQYLRPLNSIESCLMAQICKQHSQPSPCVPALRQFVVTDGTRVISRPSFDSCIVQARDETNKAISDLSETVFAGIPQFPERRSDSVQQSKECNLNKGKDHVQRLSSIREMPNKTLIPLQVAPSGAALFCLGVSIGVMYSTSANKTEVIKLKDVLKQTENLVQDLEEELEMKDSLTVNELVSVDDIFPYEHESSIDKKKQMLTHFQSDSEALINYGVENSDTHKAPENLESMNQIEAELEAELERFVLNMKGSTLHRKSDDDDSDDNELEEELIQGELRADHCGSGGSGSSTTPPYSPKHCVSPRDLSLRLHQVIQSRLEERVMELETALEKSRERIRHLESGQHTHVSSSTSSFSITEAEHELPLVMNLSGEALDAYNDAFVELSKINGSDYKESPEKQLSSTSLLELGPTLVDDAAYTTNPTTIEEREMFSFDEDADESDDTLLLIRQIVEKTKRGSSAVLNAHRAMVSLDS